MGQLVQTLKERGHRLTPQRQLILDAIEAAEGHISAEWVHSKVAAQFPQVNISTVYRTLELLQNMGLVTHTHFDDGIAIYHLAEDSHHQHMVCRGCGAERSACAWTAVAPAIHRKPGVSIRASHARITTPGQLQGQDDAGIGCCRHNPACRACCKLLAAMSLPVDRAPAPSLSIYARWFASNRPSSDRPASGIPARVHPVLPDGIADAPSPSRRNHHAPRRRHVSACLLSMQRSGSGRNAGSVV